MYSVVLPLYIKPIINASSSKVYSGFCGESGRYKPNRFLQAILCRLNLSSGENRAGWALPVFFLAGVSFCVVDCEACE
jgi:hypothetical protein